MREGENHSKRIKALEDTRADRSKVTRAFEKKGQGARKELGHLSRVRKTPEGEQII